MCMLKSRIFLQGKARFIAGEIAGFDGANVRLKSGNTLHADILVTACELLTSPLPPALLLCFICRLSPVDGNKKNSTSH